MKKKQFLAIAAVLLIVAVSIVWLRPKSVVHAPTETQSTHQGRITLSGTTLSVKLATTDTEREQGLSGTAPLEPNSGMLFVFDKPDMYGFWMKDMNYSLDMIWIGNDKKIVGVTENATPESYPTVFKSKSPAQYVLEVSAGFAKEHQVKIDDPVVIEY